MESLDPLTTHAFRAALEKVLRPRDETIDHHSFHEQVLAQTYGEIILRHPLALLPPEVEAASRPVDEKATSSRLEELIDTNIRLNKELRQLQEASRPGPDSSDVGSVPTTTTTTTKPNTSQASPNVQDSEVIALQLQVNALEEKRSRLGIFLGALDRLETLPAAEPEFLHPSAVFRACGPLPEMPGALMEGFTRDSSAPQHEIETMMRGLHKAVLRNKLLAQREKRKLDAMRERGAGRGGLADPSALPAEVQLHALTAVKDHLIGWIEAQLMEAGDEEEVDDDDVGQNSGSGLPQRSSGTAAKTSNQKGEADLDTQLADIQREYSEHINLRKEVAMLLAETEGVSQELEQFRGMRITEDPAPQQSSKPPASLSQSPAFNPPAVLMLTPYLEKLQASAREQKALVQEKSHINSAVTRQQQHMSQVIHDLVEESQLLRAYPNATALDAANHRSSRRSSSNTRRSFADATRKGGSTTSKTSVSKQVEPFVYAADSAKIATLEAVVDKIELGQMAVDEAMGRLGEVRRFLNKTDADNDDDAGTRGNRRDSVQIQATPGHRRRITEGKIIIADQQEKSIWSKLDGNLGLIND
ncbi:hypothetical protein MN608_04821 [Microdochium nivale]|nr:hypothetical protein MN608_04821 [Microdochium nivale]